MGPDEGNRIADALESLDSRIADIEDNVADAAAAADELSKSISSLPDLANAVRAMSNEMMHLRADFNRWVKSESEQKSDIRKRLRTLEDGKNA